jgi:hypothetical protein
MEVIAALKNMIFISNLNFWGNILSIANIFCKKHN